MKSPHLDRNVSVAGRGQLLAAWPIRIAVSSRSTLVRWYVVHEPFLSCQRWFAPRQSVGLLVELLYPRLHIDQIHREDLGQPPWGES
jgi:hypothetical protein